MFFIITGTLMICYDLILKKLSIYAISNSVKLIAYHGLDYHNRRRVFDLVDWVLL